MEQTSIKTPVRFLPIEIDPLGGTLQTKLPDDTVVSVAFNNATDTPAAFNRTFVTVTDQAGKKRRQLADALGRIVRVDEPGANGDLGSVGTPVQPTDYQFDGNDNLTKVTQSIPGVATQVREFVYDCGLNNNARGLIRELGGKRGPALQKITTGLMIGSGSVIAAPYIASAATSATVARDRCWGRVL